MAGVIDSAVNWAVSIANNAAHGYSMNNRWGPDYDCSSFVITAYQNAGVSVKDEGATNTSNMRKVFFKCGFIDVTGLVNLTTGKGLIRGDVLLNESHHAALVVSKDGEKIVHASTDEDKYTQSGDQTGKEIYLRSYYNHPWNYVLRYNSNQEIKYVPMPEKKIIDVPAGLGKMYLWMNWNTVTNMNTRQGELIKRAGQNYNSEGYGIVGNRLTVAMTDTFGKIGDYVDIQMENGRVINGIIADLKSQIVVPWDLTPANKWGHYNGQNIVEFVTNWKDGHDNPPSDGAVLQVINLGSYFDNSAYATGQYTPQSTEMYLYSENAYENSVETVIWNNRQAENIHPVLTSLLPLKANGTLTLYANEHNITSYMGDLSWHNSLNELATTLSFSSAKSDAKYLSDLIYTPVEGDIVRMAIDEEVFCGMIITADDSDKFYNRYEVVDLGWYLNKTSQTYQFNNITATDAIRQICDDLYIPVAYLCEIDTIIKQIYFDKCISDILSDILSRCPGEYNFDFTPKGIRIYRIGDFKASPMLYVASNVKTVKSVDFMGNMTHSRSIEDMKNSIKVTSNKDKVYTELTVMQNRDMINQFGFLQEIVNIDPEKENAQTVAEEQLNELCRIKEEFSFEIVEKENCYTRAGEVFDIEGHTYVIEEAEHNYKGGIHYNSLSVRRKEG